MTSEQSLFILANVNTENKYYTVVDYMTKFDGFTQFYELQALFNHHLYVFCDSTPQPACELVPKVLAR